MPFQFRVNIDRELSRLFGEVPVLVPSAVLEELSRLDQPEAKSALALARKYSIVETEERGDDGVLDVALRTDAVVVTNDKDLIARLKAARVGIVRLRQRRYLIFEGQE